MLGFFGDVAVKKADEARAKPRLRGDVPIESLSKLGCAACPRDKANLKHGKMLPVENPSASVYFLSVRPTKIEDDSGPWSGIAARELRSKFPPRVWGDARFGHIVQCAPDDKEGLKHPAEQEIACCHGRVVSDIETTKPLVVVGIGDEPLHWATGLPRNALMFRGTFIPVRIGKHACWYYPLIYPNYTDSERKGKSQFETTMEHDVRVLVSALDNLDKPHIEDGPYDTGLQIITGREPGDMQRLENELHKLVQLREVGFDIETSGLRPYDLDNPRVLTAAFGTRSRSLATSVSHPEGWGSETRINRVWGLLVEFMQQVRLNCHNVAFEQEWVAYFAGNQALRRIEWGDTMAMAWAHDERTGTKSLDVQCRLVFGFFLKAVSGNINLAEPEWWLKHPLEKVLRYNGMDAIWTDALARHYQDSADNREVKLYEERLRLAPTLVLTSARGLPVDYEYAEDMYSKIDAKTELLEAKVRKTTEVEAFTRRYGTFSITNDNHVLKLMRDVLSRPEITKAVGWAGETKDSVDEEALEAMPEIEVPSAKIILEHRGLERNKTTYLGPLLNGETASRDGLIRYDYTSMDTVTSRLNSKAHNWPKHKHKEVRGCIAPGNGQWFVAADYGQIEFRVAGMLSQDEAIIRACWTGYDVHKFWAERIVDLYPSIKDAIVDEFGIDWDQKGMKTLRQSTKNGWVFPMLFGATARGCAARMHMSEHVADELAGEFWDTFGAHARWQKREEEKYERNLYAETLGGFRRHGPMTRNELINAPIQGTACEIVLAGMNAMSERADFEEDAELQPAFNGHDDLSFIISDGNLESGIKIITEEMTKVRFDYINCPLIVEVSVGPRWHELEEVGKYSSEQLHGHRSPYR